MKLKVVLVAMGAFLILGASASAALSLRYRPVKTLMGIETRELCERNEHCVGYAAPCERQSAQRIVCLSETEEIYSEGTVSITQVCTARWHWFILRGELGHSIGAPRCTKVEP
jgi:hypothetical protein